MSSLDMVKKFFPKVKVVKDSTRPARIEILKSDVEKSAKKDHAHCAIATACKRKFHLDGVIVSRTKAFLVKGTLARRFQLSATLSRELTSFDRGAEFAPGVYQLARISPAQRLGAYQKGKQTGSHDPTSKPRFRHLTNKIRTVLGGQNPEE